MAEQLTDKAALMAMLGRAEAMHTYQELSVNEGTRSIDVTTGPDDAAAVFWFNEDGTLHSVSVVEALIGEESPHV